MKVVSVFIPTYRQKNARKNTHDYWLLIVAKQKENVLLSDSKSVVLPRDEITRHIKD